MTQNAKKKLETNDYIDELVAKYKYRPLPVKVSEAARAFYRSALNGFNEDGGEKVPCVNGERFCSEWSRVVVGDYGAYLEFPEAALLVELSVPHNQRWRLDDVFIKARGLSIKYRWFQFHFAKLYLQVATVKYADYRPGFFYVAVNDLD